MIHRNATTTLVFAAPAHRGQPVARSRLRGPSTGVSPSGAEALATAPGETCRPPPRLPVQRPRRGWRTSVPVAVLAAAVLTQACAASRPTGPPSAPGEQLGRAVSFALVSNQGQPVALPAAARVTVVDFWAPTCKPCREKVPALVARRAELESAGAALVLVGVLAEGESTEDAAAALRAWGVGGVPFLIDRDDVSARQAGVTALPATHVYDPDGVLRWIAAESATAGDVIEAARAAGQRR